MDVEETAKSLMQILEYKQELAKEMLRCSDEKATDQLADAITYSDEMIKKVLGITQGLMWSFFNSSIGNKVTDWQWWAILVIGAIVFAVIYHKCKD
jgi:hypothetical protein